MSKEAIIIRKKGKPSEVSVGGIKILPTQEFAKPKDRVTLEKENITETDESQSEINASEVFETKGRIKPGSTQQRNRSIIPKERKKGKMEAYVDGSYFADGVDFTEHAEGDVYNAEVAKNRKFYKPEP